jgi:hypothetical protein
MEVENAKHPPRSADDSTVDEKKWLVTTQSRDSLFSLLTLMAEHP